MSIAATIENIIFRDDGSGDLMLIGDERGQPMLSFEKAPNDVTSLIGQFIWGGSSQILLGETVIANRTGYTHIEFVVDSFDFLRG